MIDSVSMTVIALVSDSVSYNIYDKIYVMPFVIMHRQSRADYLYIIQIW